jgi:hypothetical protein
MRFLYDLLHNTHREPLCRIQTSLSTPRSKTLVVLVGNDCLPNDIFYIILEFVTNNLSGLLKFKTVCKNWQTVGESSLLWLDVGLEFFAPYSYLLETHHNRDRILNGRSDFSSVSRLIKYLSNHRLVDISTRETRLKKCYQVIVSVPVETTAEIKSPVERSKFIHDGFLYHLRNYNQKWQYYTNWKLFVGDLQNYRNFQLNQFYFSMMINSVCLFLCIYLFKDLSTTPKDNLSFQQQMGFFCLYLFWFLYSLCIVTTAIRTQFFTYLFTSEYLELNFAWGQLAPFGLYLFMFFCCFLPILLINLKLAAFPEILWVITTVPLWVLGMIFVILVRLESHNDATNRTITIALIAVVTILPITLIGYSADRQLNTHDYLKYSSIFYCTHAASLVVMLINFMYTRDFTVEPALSWSKKIRKIFFSGISVISCLATCFFLIILIIAIWKDSSFFLVNSLQPLGLLFLFLASLHLSLVFMFIDYSLT